MSNSIYSLLSACAPIQPEEIPLSLVKAQILQLQMVRETRSVRFVARGVCYAYLHEIRSFEQWAKQLLGVDDVTLDLTYPLELLDGSYMPYLLEEAAQNGVTVNGFFEDCGVKIAGGKWVIELRHGGYEILASCHVEEILSGILRRRFGAEIEVSFAGQLAISADDAAIALK